MRLSTKTPVQARLFVETLERRELLTGDVELSTSAGPESEAFNQVAAPAAVIATRSVAGTPAASLLATAVRRSYRDCSDRALVPGADLRRCDMRPLPLAGKDVHGADMTLANLAGMNLDIGPDDPRTNLTDVRLYRADLSGTVLSNTILSGANLTLAIAPDTDYEDTVLTGADFSRADLRGAEFFFSGARQARFHRANLAGASLRNSGFNEANFTLANMRDVIATEAIFQDADLSRAVLTGADLSQADASNARFYRATLTNAKLVDATLSDANLVLADLRNIVATNANFQRADLSRAKLAGADLTGADLTGARFHRATGLSSVTWSNTTCPDGTNSDTNGGTCVGHL